MIIGAPFFYGADSTMNIKPSIQIGAIAGILFFIVMGDQILPEPLKSVSYNTRTAIVNFVGRTVFKPRKVDLNEEREQQLEDIENGVGN